jgi:hypothetical protein
MRTLKIIGITLLGVLLLVGGCIAFVGAKGSKNDASAVAYLDSTLPPILGDWDVSALEIESTPELLQAVPREKLADLFQVCRSRLGRVVKYHGAKPTAPGVVSTNGAMGTYRADVEFEQGRAFLDLQLVRREKWRILRFSISSDRLNPNLSQSSPF